MGHAFSCHPTQEGREALHEPAQNTEGYITGMRPQARCLNYLRLWRLNDLTPSLPPSTLPPWRTLHSASLSWAPGGLVKGHEEQCNKQCLWHKNKGFFFFFPLFFISWRLITLQYCSGVFVVVFETPRKLSSTLYDKKVIEVWNPPILPPNCPQLQWAGNYHFLEHPKCLILTPALWKR